MKNHSADRSHNDTTTSRGKPPTLVSRQEWSSLGAGPSSADQSRPVDPSTLWLGAVSGRQLNTNVTVLFFSTNEVGNGPKWHVHDYDEVFVIRNGHALFTVGESKIEATEGDVLMGPAGVPHKFHNVGPGRLETIDIHLSPEWQQTDLPDPELDVQ